MLDFRSLYCTVFLCSVVEETNVAVPRPTPTSRQGVVIACFDSLARKMGYPPTLREVADALGIRSTSVLDHVLSLVGKGYLDRRPFLARSVTLTDKGREYLEREQKREP